MHRMRPIALALGLLAALAIATAAGAAKSEEFAWIAEDYEN